MSTPDADKNGNKAMDIQPEPSKEGTHCKKCARIGVVAKFIPWDKTHCLVCEHCGIVSMDSYGPPTPVYRYKEGMTDKQWKAVDDADEEERRIRDEGII